MDVLFQSHCVTQGTGEKKRRRLETADPHGEGEKKEANWGSIGPQKSIVDFRPMIGARQSREHDGHEGRREERRLCNTEKGRGSL